MSKHPHFIIAASLGAGIQPTAIAVVEQEILKSHPDDAAYLALQFGLRWLFAWEDPQAAESLFRTALERDPESTQAFSLLVRCLRDSERYDEVLRLAEQAAGALPEQSAKGFVLHTPNLNEYTLNIAPPLVVRVCHD